MKKQNSTKVTRLIETVKEIGIDMDYVKQLAEQEGTSEKLFLLHHFMQYYPVSRYVAEKAAIYFTTGKLPNDRKRRRKKKKETGRYLLVHGADEQWFSDVRKLFPILQRLKSPWTVYNSNMEIIVEKKDGQYVYYTDRVPYRLKLSFIEERHLPEIHHLHNESGAWVWTQDDVTYCTNKRGNGVFLYENGKRGRMLIPTDQFSVSGKKERMVRWMLHREFT